MSLRFLFDVCFSSMLALVQSVAGSELIEINRVTAKVNDRIVTWGEIQRAMDRLNFTDEEKRPERRNSWMEKLTDYYPFTFEEKGMGIPESIIEQEYNKRLIQEFNGDRKLFSRCAPKQRTVTVRI